MRVLLIDNYDSFTYMLRDYVAQCGATCDVVRNDDALLAHIPEIYDAFIISPGPGTPQTSGQLLPFLKSHLGQKPVLGICLGHQAIGELYGASLVKAAVPRHGKQERIFHENDPLFNGISPVFQAVRYHSLILEKVSPPLDIIAVTAEKEIMAIVHKPLKAWGIQFHPESCLTDRGMKIIQNFLGLAGKC